MILAIDPGANTGWACFDSNRVLTHCGLGQVTGVGFADVAIIEHPMIYPGGRTKDPNAIVKLAINAGEIAGLWRSRGTRIVWVKPREWKGTIDADVCNRRVWGRLEPDERQIVNLAAQASKIPYVGDVPMGGKGHNVLDAIGIGLFVLQRWTIQPSNGYLVK